MAFDGITTACIVKELNERILHGKIEKIYQPAPEEIILNIHGDRKNYKLLVSAGSSHARMHLIEGATANPANPPAFCMLLRKHLVNGRIREINQIESERIVEILVDSLDEMGFSVHKKLVIEIMGKHSNISLVDMDTGKIADSIKRISGDVNRYRQLLPGAPYVSPPSQDKLSFWDIDHLDGIARDIPASKAIMSHLQGISPFFAKNLCLKAGIDPDESLMDSEDIIPHALRATFAALITRIKSGLYDNILYVQSDTNTPFDFYPIDILEDASGLSSERFDSLSACLERYYESKASSSHIKQKSADLLKIITTALDKLYLKKKRLSEDIAEAENSEALKLTGELLTASIYLIKQGERSILVDNYYDGSKVKIALDPLLSPSENVQRYYKKYNKSKTAVKEKNIQLAETIGDINYLESVLTFVENAQDFGEITDIRQELIEGKYIKKRKQNQKPEKSGLKPYEYTTSDGFRLAVGRNNKQNDTLTLKTASNKDIWLHTKDIPGSHVILFTEGKEPSETALMEAAAIAAYHSKARTSDNVPVDYTLVKHVHKPSGAKPGMVIFYHNKTLYVRPAIPQNTQ